MKRRSDEATERRWEAAGAPVGRLSFPLLRMCEARSIGEFVDFWKGRYNYPNDALYSGRIRKPRLTPSDIEKLYEWKNGSPLSAKKRGTVARVISHVAAINGLKNEFELSIFKSTFGWMSAIWKVYLMHIIAPDRFPIFDQHVGRAYFYLTQGEIKEIPAGNCGRETLYFSQYVCLFDEWARGVGNRKHLDEALWAFGKWLKTAQAKSLVDDGSDCRPADIEESGIGGPGVRRGTAALFAPNPNP